MPDLKVLSILLTVVGLFTGSARATLIPKIDVPAMVSASELVVVGRAALTVWSPGAPETFIIRADSVLKNSGTAPQGQLVVELALSSPGYRGVSEGQYGIFFLRRPAPGQPYTDVDPYHPVVAVSPLRNSGPSSATDPLSSVTQELAAVFTTPSAALLDPTTGVQALVTAPPAEQVQWIYYNTAAALASIPYETAGPSLRALATSGTTLARLWATNCLLSMGRSDEIEELKLSSLQSLEPILLNPGPDVALTVSMLGNAMLGRIMSPMAVPHLSVSLGSTNPAIRRAAAGNLSRIATAAVIAPLATVALNDQSPDVRYYAVLGLAKATGVRVRPTRAAYDAAETDMLAFWSEWAKGNVH